MGMTELVTIQGERNCQTICSLMSTIEVREIHHHPAVRTYRSVATVADPKGLTHGDNVMRIRTPGEPSYNCNPFVIASKFGIRNSAKST